MLLPRRLWRDGSRVRQAELTGIAARQLLTALMQRRERSTRRDPRVLHRAVWAGGRHRLTLPRHWSVGREV